MNSVAWHQLTNRMVFHIAFQLHTCIIKDSSIPTSSKSKKVRNFAQNQKCCIIVDVYDNEKGKGVMLQGPVTVTKSQFENHKQLVESATGWKLHEWDVGKIGEQKVDLIIVFKPQRWVVIGTL
jgi:Pyridoxamine 5'-phosphate oxidase